jgi:hypothetical protein
MMKDESIKGYATNVVMFVVPNKFKHGREQLEKRQQSISLHGKL